MSKEQFDERMDELSREAANLQGLPFTEEAWQQMEELLNKKEKRRRAIIWWWIAPLALLLIGGGIYFATTEKNKHSSVANTTTNKNVPISTPKNKTEIVNPTTNTQLATREQNTNTQKNNDAVTVSIDDNVVLKEQTNKRKQATTEFKNQQSPANSTVEVVTNQPITFKQNKTKANSKINAKQNVSKQETVMITPPIEENMLEANNTFTEIKEDSNTKNKTFAIEPLLPKATYIVKEEIKKNVDTTIAPIAKKEKPKAKKSFLSKWEISAAAAGDLTTVHFKKAEKISTAYGIGITFFATKKLSISTGVGFAKKLYNADSADYKSTPYFTRYSRVQNITADCRVIEMPINLQYLIKQNKNNSWLAVLGLSNYFMKNENYLYDYTESGVPKTVTYMYENQNNHLLSVLNFAIAYRRRISPQLSWQLSPFGKIPLTGIGQGKIQLSSFGLQGSLHFKLKK